MIGGQIRKTWLLALVLISTAAVSLAADTAAPQTARQALIEMFLSPTPGTLEKHLPEVTRAAIQKAQNGSSAAMLTSFATMASAMQSRGQHLQTFDTGSTLVLFEDPQQHTSLEAIVERDDLQGEEDQIEVSFRASKNGESQTAGMKPHLTFTMKPEGGIWRLQDITVTLSLSLTEPALLKAISTPIRPTLATGSDNQAQPTTNWGAMRAGNEASALNALRAMIAAQTNYAALYPSRGFTCTLSDLGGMGGTERNEHQAMLIDPRLASGKKNDYRFSLSGCDGSPASKFTVVAVPLQGSVGMRTFCSDQSGVIRTSSDPSPDSCVINGKPLE